MEYVDKNANNISNTDYGKPLREDRLVHLIDKLHIDNGKQVERQTTAHNHIAAAAVAPALLLANHISAPVLPEKSQNGDVKTEVCNFFAYFFCYNLLYFFINLTRAHTDLTI